MSTPTGFAEADLRGLAPDAFDAFDRVASASRAALAPPWGRIVSEAVAATLGVGPRPDVGSDVADETAPQELLVVQRFAEQFVVDVSAMTDELRAATTTSLGGDAFAVVQVIWAREWALRAQAAWRQLFGVVADGEDRPGPPLDPPAGDGEPARPDVPGAPELWPAIEAFLGAVARLDRLDPLATELVRLRGARAHDCRLCRSRRDVRAVDAGAGEDVFDQVDHYRHSDLSPSHQVALGLTDALVWTPTAYPAGLVDQVRDAFEPAETVELVLDVVRNSANKIAVALGADQAQVPEGQLEYFDVRPDGELVYGVAPA